MKLHDRAFIVNQADAEIGLALLELRKKHALTTAEFLSILAAEMQQAIKYAIRAERHPDDPNKRGDEE